MRRPILALAALFTALAAPACDDATAAKPTDYTELLKYLGDQVVMPEHDAFAARGDELVVAMKKLESGPTTATLTGAENAWRAARAAFRRLDALHFGPVADRGISERIDLAPAAGDDIEALVAGSEKLDASVVADAGGYTKGFLGVEYLIFSTDGTADALDTLTGKDGDRRRTLARLMAEEIAASAHELDDAWRPEGGNYLGEFELAGTKSKRYASQRGAIDDIVGSVGYAWEVVVGIRLAQPLGRKGNGKPDPTLDPTLRSDSAIPDMTASMAGVDALYTGEGFGSRVRTKSQREDDQMSSEIDDCSSAITAIPAPFGRSVVDRTALVQKAYDACDSGKATWNTDITSALGATLRPGDNDGD